MECIGIKLRPTIHDNLFGYAMPQEDILTTLYYYLSRCFVQLCYLYKSGVVIHDYKICKLLSLEQIHSYLLPP